jgi:hypothetical protein
MLHELCRNFLESRNPPLIAISYRPDDSLLVTVRSSPGGIRKKGNVFIDFDSIPYGVDVRDHIKQMIDRSNVLIAMIGPDWVGRRNQRHRSLLIAQQPRPLRCFNEQE